MRGTLTRFGRAVAGRDYRAGCAQLLAPTLAEKLTEIGLPCEIGLARGFGTAQNPRLSVRAVRVQGSTGSALVHSTATNQPPSDDTIGLIKLNGAWRIASLAAAPRAASKSG